MCGIAGVYDRRVSEDALDALSRTLAHCGPDDQGRFVDTSAGVALVHRRLSILDLSPLGRQPMRFENLVIVLNGEIYNFREIRAELELEGYLFTSQSDTEVALKAFHRWGPDAVHRFVGMFAFAVYDSRAGELFVFRDRVGVKPLYYTVDGGFAFASELTGFRPLPGSQEPDFQAVAEVLQYGYVAEPRTILRGVSKLETGYYLHVTATGLTRHCYWSIEPFFQTAPTNRTDNDWLDELEALLAESFAYRMVSDVPVGLFLSGGTDSSLVAALLARDHPDLHCFTIGFAEARYDESAFAEQVAKHLGLQIHQRRLNRADLTGMLDRFFSIYDEPFADTSGIPTALVSALAKEHGMKVVLGGDGGDEFFCGYTRYHLAQKVYRFANRLPGTVRKILAKSLQSAHQHGLARLLPLHNADHKLGQLGQMLSRDGLEDLYEDILKSVADHELPTALHLPASSREARNFDPALPPMQRMMLADFQRYLPGDLLVKTDRATMHHGLEGREPMLDHRQIEFAARMPFDLKFRNGVQKYALKKILERHLPRELVHRPKKGFGIPVQEWFGTELNGLFDRYLSPEAVRNVGVLNPEFVAGERKRIATQGGNMGRLWNMLVLQRWFCGGSC